MRRRLFPILLLLACVIGGDYPQAAFAHDKAQATSSLTQFVNPRIGTGGHGHVFLGANVPFGYIQLGPTEHTRGWDWCSGYHQSDSILIGFGHQHLSGTGIGELGDVAFLPVTDAHQKEVLFHHANENVRPGYYAVKLQQPNVWVELTATKRAGFHRYTFGADVKKAQLVLDLFQGIGWDKPTDYALDEVKETAVAGHRFSTGWAKDQKNFFVAEFSQPVQVQPLDSGRWLVQVADATRPLMIKVGLSAVSIANARQNLQTEIPDWNFHQVVAQADEAWNRELAKVKVETSDSIARRIFYTKWDKLREEYRAAGMTEDAIQKMYEYDLAVFNDDRAHHRYDVEIPTADDSENQSNYVEYERATTVTDTYHETKTRFAWVGEIENTRLQSALEDLSEDDLLLVSMYVYEGYDTVEISKVFGTTKQNISKKIRRISKFIKNFQIEVV